MSGQAGDKEAGDKETRLLGLSDVIRDMSTVSAYKLPGRAAPTKTERKPVEISNLSLAIGFVCCIAVLVALHRVSKRTSFTSTPGSNAAFVCIGIGFATGFSVYAVFRYAERLSKKVAVVDSDNALTVEDDNIRPSSEHILHPCRTGEQYWVLKSDAFKQTIAANACSDAKHVHMFLGTRYANKLGNKLDNSDVLRRLPETLVPQVPKRTQSSSDTPAPVSHPFTWVQRSTGNPLIYVDKKLFAGVSPGENSMAAVIQALAAYIGERVEVYEQLIELASLPQEQSSNLMSDIVNDMKTKWQTDMEKAGEVIKNAEKVFENAAKEASKPKTPKTVLNPADYFPKHETFINAPSPLRNSGICILESDGKLLARKCDDRSTQFQFEGDRIRSGKLCLESDGMDVTLAECDENNRDQKFVREGGEIWHEQSDKCLISTQSTFSGKQVEMGECGDPAESWTPFGRSLKTKDGKCLSGTGVALFNGKCDGEWQVVDGHVYHTESGRCLYGQTGSDRLGFAECSDAEGQLFDDRDGYMRNKLADRCIAFTQLDQVFLANCKTDTNNRILYQTQEGSEVAESTAPERVMFRHKDTQKCLSAKEGELYAQCAAGDPAQEWSMKDYQLKADGKCLGVCSGKPVMRSCARDNTEWRLDDAGHLTHIDTGLCLGVDEMTDCERAGHFEATVL